MCNVEPWLLTLSKLITVGQKKQKQINTAQKYISQEENSQKSLFLARELTGLVSF
jgi:hypothetical protein